MGWEISGIMEWSGKFLIYAGVSHDADHLPYQVADKIRKWLLPWDCYGCCYGWYRGMTVVVAMVGTMGWLWLLLWLVPWDDYGCCYGWYHGMTMVAAMVVAMVGVMVGVMGLLWLLLWRWRWPSGVIIMTITIAVAERSDG